MRYGEVSLRARAIHLSKLALAPVLYRHPPIGLQPERLYLWLATLVETASVDGAVVEIGISSGGTAAFSDRMLHNLDIVKPYVAIDTFSGFVERQWQDDARLGTPAETRHMFSASSQRLVRRIVSGLGAPEIQLVEGDICELPDSALPDRISACLIDVDLSEPVRVALERIRPRLQPGGVILVDDCPAEGDWRARTGYQSFIASSGYPEAYRYGMGIIREPLEASSLR